MDLEPVIGLEVHVHLDTKSKMFCGCQNVSEADKPNLYVCPVCMGLPGTLPVTNRQAVEWTILAGLALGCKIAEHCTFARKSYFYPDLPKGYQISQYDEPLCFDGELHVLSEEGERIVRIQRVHLEEDAAKNLHAEGATLVDHNRAGTPLMEIVTGPDLRSPEEARLLLENVQRTMRYLGISRADMEHGDLRVDANISLRPRGQGSTALSAKTEVKNLNSFRAVERALLYEVDRQTKLWEDGMPPNSPSTRGWDDTREETVEQRMKEEEADYRYFPEPDIPPLRIDPAVVDRLRQALPELPHLKEERFRRQYDFTAADAHLLAAERELAAYAEEVFSEISAWVRDLPEVERRESKHLWKLAVNYLLGDVRKVLAERGTPIGSTKMSPENFAELVLMLHRGEVNRNAVPELLRVMDATGGDPSSIVQTKALGQVSDLETLRRHVQDVIAVHPVEVEKVLAGKTAVLEFLVGQVMAKTNGRANPESVRDLFREELGLSNTTDMSGA